MWSLLRSSSFVISRGILSRVLYTNHAFGGADGTCRKAGQAWISSVVKGPLSHAAKAFSDRGLATLQNRFTVRGELVTDPIWRRPVGLWLGACATWVGSMVVLGGITRLTKSGLSMVDWSFHGRLPPLSESEWYLEFDKYKNSPEYKKMHSWMQLDDFKFIWWMEYGHRMWGRALAVVSIGPLVYFGFKGALTRSLFTRFGLLFAAGASQAGIGWWMVKSGLEDPENHGIPRVSPYRLATHLSAAFCVFSGLMWTAFDVLWPVESRSVSSVSQIQSAFRIRPYVVGLGSLIAITALSGAYVAGLEAGHAYNTWPLMDGKWIPDGMMEYKPVWRNMFENTAMVQFDHRCLALTTLASVTGLWAFSRTLNLSPIPQCAMNTLLAVVSAQVGLGIATLLNNVPVWLGSLHQTNALTLFSTTLFLLHSLRQPALSRSILRANQGPLKSFEISSMR